MNEPNIKFMFCEMSDGITESTGCYSWPAEEISIYLPMIHKYSKTEQELCDKICFDLEHETLHHCVISTLFEGGVITSDDPHFITKNEYIVRTMLGQPKDAISLASYRIKDIERRSTWVYKHRGLLAWLVTISFVGIMFSVLLLLGASIGLLLRWLF